MLVCRDERLRTGEPVRVHPVPPQQTVACTIWSHRQDDRDANHDTVQLRCDQSMPRKLSASAAHRPFKPVACPSFTDTVSAGLTLWRLLVFICGGRVFGNRLPSLAAGGSMTALMRVLARLVCGVARLSPARAGVEGEIDRAMERVEKTQASHPQARRVPYGRPAQR